MDRPRSPSRAFPQGLDDGDAPVAGRNRQVRRTFAEDKFARDLLEADKRAPKPSRTEMPPPVVGELLYFEGNAKGFGQGDDLIVVTGVRA